MLRAASPYNHHERGNSGIPLTIRQRRVFPLEARPSNHYVEVSRTIPETLGRKTYFIMIASSTEFPSTLRFADLFELAIECPDMARRPRSIIAASEAFVGEAAERWDQALAKEVASLGCTDNITVKLWRVDGINRRLGDPITKSVAQLELPDDLGELLQYMILAHHSENAREIIDEL